MNDRFGPLPVLAVCNLPAPDQPLATWGRHAALWLALHQSEHPSWAVKSRSRATGYGRSSSSPNSCRSWTSAVSSIAVIDAPPTLNVSCGSFCCSSLLKFGCASPKRLLHVNDVRASHAHQATSASITPPERAQHCLDPLASTLHQPSQRLLNQHHRPSHIGFVQPDVMPMQNV